jgi:O-methyltransferase
MREIGRHAWLHVGVTWKEALNSGLGKSLGLQLVSRETLAQIRAQEQVQAQLAQAAPRTEQLSTPAPDPVHAEGEGEGEGNAAQNDGLPVDYEPEFAEIWNLVKDRTMTGPAKGYYLHRAVTYVTAQQIPGAIVECGVWRGGSMLNVAHTLARLGVSDRELYLFDTFSGMSEPTDRDLHLGKSGTPAATILDRVSRDSWMWAIASLDDVKAGFSSVDYPSERVHFVEGKVEDTIPAQAPDEIAILRLDTDWYESTRHELTHLYRRLAPGGVLIIDDYGTWKGSKDATDEFVAETGEPLLFVRTGRGRAAVKPGLTSRVV